MRSIKSIHEELVAIICAPEGSEWSPLKEQVREALALVHKDEHHATKLIKKVLTTGSARAREESREEVLSMFGEITEAYAKDPSTWKIECPHILGPSMIEEIMHTWVIYNINDEYRTGDSIFALARKTSWALHSVGKDQLNLTSYPVSYESWRGIAALAVSKASNAVYDKEELLAFVKYAGHHPDLKSVLDTARERNTIEVELIETIVSNQKGIAKPLRNGTL